MTSTARVKSLSIVEVHEVLHRFIRECDDSRRLRFVSLRCSTSDYSYDTALIQYQAVIVIVIAVQRCRCFLVRRASSVESTIKEGLIPIYLGNFRIGILNNLLSNIVSALRHIFLGRRIWPLSTLPVQRKIKHNARTLIYVAIAKAATVALLTLITQSQGSLRTFQGQLVPISEIQQRQLWNVQPHSVKTPIIQLHRGRKPTYRA